MHQWQANGEMELLSAVARNYTTDSRHLVLLHGFQLTGYLLTYYWTDFVDSTGCSIKVFP